MLRHLPEGSRYVAAVTVDRDDEDAPDRERDPQFEAVMDRRVWNMDRRLQAATINAINMNTAATGMWSDGPPDFPTIGPASWQQDAPKKKEEEPEYTDNFDFFRKKGFPLG